ncbi:MAG: hypothetical protein QXO71_11530 [Candidatus Jordarchaeaceae archaeon]
MERDALIPEPLNPIWERIRGWRDDIDKISSGNFDDLYDAIRQLAEFVYILAEEVGRLLARR